MIGKTTLPPFAKPTRGLPSALAFAFPLAAAVVALGFDILFLNVSIPGIGGYAWYLTTALSFAGAGYAAAGFTRASKSAAIAAIVVGSIVYAIADLGLTMVVEHVSLTSAIIIAAQGLAIGLVTGIGGVHRAASANED